MFARTVLSHLRLGRFVLRQYLFFRRSRLRELEAAWQQSDGSFDKRSFRRIGYYALLVPVVCGDIPALLRGRSLSKAERSLLTELGIFTPLLDDWYDQPVSSEMELPEIIFNPSRFQPRNTLEQLTLASLMRLRQLTPSQINWESVARQLMSAQADSKRQSDQKLTLEEIREITFRKGGLAMLIARIFLAPPADDSENKALFQIGGLIQYLDDLFDVYEDNREKVRTLATEALSIGALRQDYLHEIHHLYKLLLNTGYPESAIHRVMQTTMVLWARGLVCLDQLQTLTLNRQGVWHVGDYERKELICDMEKPGNLFKSFWSSGYDYTKPI